MSSLCLSLPSRLGDTLLRTIAGFCASLTLNGCAAIFDSTTQQISVNTKTKNDITIVCAKPGYTDATYLNKSGIAGATFASILGGVVTGGIAWAIDSSSGADNSKR